VHNTRVRYVVGNFGRLRRRGASLQLGFPVFGEQLYAPIPVVRHRPAELHGLRSDDVGGVPLQRLLRSTIGASLMRGYADRSAVPNRGHDGPAGACRKAAACWAAPATSQRADLEGHFYAPIGTLGSSPSANVKFVLGFSTRSGFVFGNSPFFEQLFTLGGTQFFIPLRGYERRVDHAVRLRSQRLRANQIPMRSARRSSR